jgi:hypothetical protein
MTKDPDAIDATIDQLKKDAPADSKSKILAA